MNQLSNISNHVIIDTIHHELTRLNFTHVLLLQAAHSRWDNPCGSRRKRVARGNTNEGTNVQPI